MPALPEGIVTFLFSDVEGSTQLLERHGDAMGRVLARHHELFQQIVRRREGVIFETVGDAVYAAFSQPSKALATAIEVHRALAQEDWGDIRHLSARIAIHSGPVQRRGDHYFGPALFRVARLQALGHGEQTLVSGVTAQLAAGGLPEGAALRDLGTHHLRDLGEPERVFQLVHPDLRARFPPLKALNTHLKNLPAQLSSFVGRESERAEVGDLITTHRLVTLLGPGGIGKTRLAVQVAADRAEVYPDGVWFADLAAIHEAELLPEAVARILGLRAEPDLDLDDLLRQHFGTHNLLLVLDNLEQVREAAAARVREWLQDAPGLTILATSRLRIGVPDEVEIHVRPLRLPASDDPDAVRASPAGDLFLRRSREGGAPGTLDSTSARALGTLLRRLDGLPLAIELAAARTRIMTPDEILVRLEHRGLSAIDRRTADPHGSVLHILNWTLDMLSSEDMDALSLLCVCAGFDLQLAEALVPEVDAVEVLDTLVSLGLVQSSVTAIGTRFNVLETIRAVVARRTSQDAEATNRDRHARAVFASVLDRLRRESDGGADLFEKLDAEAGNLRKALDWLRESDPVRGVELWDAIFYPFWTRLGRLREGMTWFQLAAERIEAPTLEVSRAWVKYAMNSAWILDDAGVVAAMRHAVHVARLVADTESEVGALAALAGSAENEGDPGLAREVDDRLSALRPEGMGDELRMRVAEARHHVSVVLHGPASDEAMEPLIEAIDLAAAAGHRQAQTALAGNLAIARLHRADIRSAVKAGERAVELARQFRSPLLPWTLTILAMARAGAEDVTAATATLSEAIAATVEADMPVQTCDTLLAAIPVAIAAGDARLAARLWGAATAMERAGSASIPPGDRALASRSFSRARRLLPALDIELAIQDGAAADPIVLLRAVPELLAVQAGAGSEAPPQLRHGSLTKREVEVLALVAEGKSDVEIASMLFISPKTASVHVSNAKAKLGVESRLEVALKARALGLVSGPAEQRKQR